MAIDPNSVSLRFSEVVQALTKESGVTFGSGKKGFGSSGLKITNKIFAMLSSKDEFVVKLPEERVARLVASGDGHQFDPGHGRFMKE